MNKLCVVRTLYKSLANDLSHQKDTYPNLNLSIEKYRADTNNKIKTKCQMRHNLEHQNQQPRSNYRYKDSTQF